MIQYVKFGQNPLFGWRDRVQTSFFWSKFDIQSAGVTLKMCQCHQNLILNFCPMSKWCFHASLVKIHQLVQEVVCRQNSFLSLYSVVTLKIRSMSPKSDQIFKLSQHYNIWSLARFRHLVQEIECRQAFFGQTLKLLVFIVWWPRKLGQGHQNLIKSLIHTNVKIYMKFGQNPSFVSRDREQTSFFGQNLKFQSAGMTLKMRSVSPKSNHFFPSSQ